MRRTSLLICVSALAVLCFAPAASAKPMEATCVTSSSKVVGSRITGDLFATNVDPSQARFATCAQARRAMQKVAQLGLEQPRGDVGGFYCVPTVFFTGPDFVLYKCTFKGADTATFIRLTFAAQYKS